MKSYMQEALFIENYIKNVTWVIAVINDSIL